MKKVCLDAGHYGKYNRSPVMTSYYESDMTWKLHNYLADELTKRGIGVVKTRANQATDRELVSRGYASKGCDLFLSLHSNAASNSTAAYAVCIYMRPNSSQTYDDRSKDIAEKLSKTVGKTMGVNYKTYYKEYIGDRDGNGKQDDEWYGVLQGAKRAGVPGVIVEHGFHTNLKDTQWLSNDNNLKKMAAAEADTIAEWLGVKTTPTPTKTGYLVKVTDLLNVRKGPGVEYDAWYIKGQTPIPSGGVYTIVDEATAKDGGKWGLLKAFSEQRNGWINLGYTKKV